MPAGDGRELSGSRERCHNVPMLPGSDVGTLGVLDGDAVLKVKL